MRRTRSRWLLGLPVAAVILWLVASFVAAALQGGCEEEPLVDERPETEVHRPTPRPDRILLSWTGDPSTSQTVTWRTDDTVARAAGEIAVAEDGSRFADKAKSVDGRTVPLETDLGKAHYHEVRFEGLQPDTKYAYRVGSFRGRTSWAQFRTAARTPQPFSFVYFGDAQNELKAHWPRVFREAYSDAPKARFMLHAGDLINRANRDGEWGEWCGAGGWANAMVPTIAIPGNHEYERDRDDRGISRVSRHWRPQFAFPENGPKGLEETAYWIDFQGVRIIGLNSNERHEDQAAWLDSVLADNPNRWTVATHHHPVYSAKSDRGNPALRRLWQPIYDKHRVDIVLQGHDHSYARTGLRAYENEPTGLTTRSAKAGTLYVVSVAGPKMYDGDAPGFVRQAEGTQLYQIITVDGDALRYEARTAVGKPYDAFTLRKRPGQVNELIEQVPDVPENRRGAPESAELTRSDTQP